MITHTTECIVKCENALGEGVLWHAQEQAVYWVDIIASMLYRLNPDNTTQQWHFPGQISSVVPCTQGGLLATFENGLSHIDLDTESVTLLRPLELNRPNNRFNDGCSDALGQFWFGSMDNLQKEALGSYYRLNVKGDVEKQEQFGRFCITNGPAFSPDGGWIYFNDTVERIVYRAPLTKLGGAGRPEKYVQLEATDGHPDGMCTDTQGGLWLCHFAGGRVTRFVDGDIDQVIPMPVPNITKCAFGGAKLDTLYITTAATGLTEDQRQAHPLSGGLFAIQLPYQGLAATPVARPV